MNRNKRSTVFGAALIILGLVLGLCLGMVLVERQRAGKPPLLRLPQGGVSKPGQTTPSGSPSVPVGPAGTGGVSFSQSDAKKISLRYGDDCDYRPDVQALLKQPLSWNLTGDAPTVLIIHTHASESYTRQMGQNYAETTEFRTLNTAYNMVALGEKLAVLLEEAGICVIHDRSLHDYPSYNSAYTNSRQSVQDYLSRYPSIQVVLDLHRDAVLNSDGSQYAPTLTVNGEMVAQLMLVVGTDASGMQHPRWEENLAAAVKLQVLLERQVPGITRPTILRAQRYNHDLSDGAMIVEIGTAGNSLQQAMAAVPYLAEALIGLCRGTTVDSTS